MINFFLPLFKLYIRLSLKLKVLLSLSFITSFGIIALEISPLYLFILYFNKSENIDSNKLFFEQIEYINSLSNYNFTILFVSIAIIAYIIKTLYQYLITTFYAKISNIYVSSLYSSIYNEDYIKFKENGPNKYLNLINISASKLTFQLTQIQQATISITSLIVFTTFSIFQYGKIVIILFSLGLFPFLILQYITSLKLSKLGKSILEKEEELLLKSRNDISAFSIIIIEALDSIFKLKFDELSYKLRRLQALTQYITSLNKSTISLVFYLFIGLITLILSSSNITKVGIPTISVILIICQRITNDFSMISNSIGSIANFRNHINAYDKFLPQKLGIINPKSEKQYKAYEKFNSLEIKDLEFNFKNNKNILNGINVLVKRKDRIQIKGDSGKGKTTLILIIAGIYRTTAGNIFLNKKLLLKPLYKEIRCSILMQNPLLYDCTLLKYLYSLADIDKINYFDIDDKLKDILISLNLKTLLLISKTKSPFLKLSK